MEDALRCPISAEPPDYLETKADIARFEEIADLLTSVDEQLCTALDADQLARYVICEDVFKAYSRKLRAAIKGGEITDLDKLQRQQNTAFQQVQTCASALGLNVSSRLRFDLRKPEKPKRNKFDELD